MTHQHGSFTPLGGKQPDRAGRPHRATENTYCASLLVSYGPCGHLQYPLIHPTSQCWTGVTAHCLLCTSPKWMREVGSTGILMEYLPQASTVIAWRDGPVSAITRRQRLSPLSIEVHPRTQIYCQDHRAVAFRNSSRLPSYSKGGYLPG